MKPIASAAKSFGLDIFKAMVNTARQISDSGGTDGVRQATGTICAELLSHRNLTRFSLSYGKYAHWIDWKAKYRAVRLENRL